MNNLASDQPNPLKILKNISCFKKIIKGFKTDDLDTLLSVLMYQPKLIHSCLTKGFILEDADYFKLSCKVYYNIPLVSSAWFGNERGYSIQQCTDSHLPASGFDCRNMLNDFLKTIELPEKIMPVKIEINQTIQDIESTFTYKVNTEVANTSKVLS